MKHWSIVLLCCLLWVFPGLAYAGEYVLGPGDVLTVNVFGIPDLAVAEAVVGPDGIIMMPPIGEVLVSGMTATELSAQMTGRLKKYYVEPVVTVSIKTFRTTRIYVVGEVMRPGAYDLEKSHTLMDAIGAAQGWTQDALKTKVYIVRNGTKNEPMTVNLLDILKKGDTGKNYNLHNGDIVFLSKSRRIDINRDVIPIINPIWLMRNWVSTDID